MTLKPGSTGRKNSLIGMLVKPDGFSRSYAKNTGVLKKSLRNNSAPPEFTSLGSVIIRRSFGPGDAYAYQRLFLQAPEWKELAGYQNDWMKGCWLNKPELRICLYTEGDVTELICDTEDQFEAELDAIRRF